MTRPEFATVIAYLAAAIGKPLSADATEVYFDLLGDLPREVLQIAAKRIALEHRWATFPTVAELRQAAAETLQGQKAELTPAEAWEAAWDAVKRIDLGIDGSLQRHCEGLPPLVVEAMKAFGIPSLTDKNGAPVSVVRGQFLKIFEQLQASKRRLALLPASVARAIELVGAEHGERPALPFVQKIGVME